MGGEQRRWGPPEEDTSSPEVGAVPGSCLPHLLGEEPAMATGGDIGV